MIIFVESDSSSSSSGSDSDLEERLFSVSDLFCINVSHLSVYKSFVCIGCGEEDEETIFGGVGPKGFDFA